MSTETLSIREASAADLPPVIGVVSGVLDE